jgi:hypothetical protein
MKLINKITSDWEISNLIKEMDEVLQEYQNLIKFTQLNEGVLDDLGDDVLKQVAEIKRRIEVITRARNIVTKLQKSGGFTKDEVSKHRARLTSNRKSLSAALKRTSKKMKDFQQTAAKEIKKAGEIRQSEGPASDINLEVYGRYAPFLLNMAEKGELDSEMMNNENYQDTYASLKEDGLISPDGRITKKGKDALMSNRMKRKGTGGPRDAVDDLSDMGNGYDDDMGGYDDIDDIDDLNFG